MCDTYSVFDYLYRDASNYKAFGSVLLAGHATDEDRAKIEAKLTTDGVFIPEFVGLNPLQAQLDGFPSGDDHIWHECVGLRAATLEESREVVWGDLSDLVRNFVRLPLWNSDEMYRRVRGLLDSERYRSL